MTRAVCLLLIVAALCLLFVFAQVGCDVLSEWQAQLHTASGTTKPLTQAGADALNAGAESLRTASPGPIAATALQWGGYVLAAIGATVAARLRSALKSATRPWDGVDRRQVADGADTAQRLE